MTVIPLSEVSFAATIRIGKENYEKNFIDPLNRQEDRFFRLFYVPEQMLVYIISVDPALKNPKLAHKRKKVCGLPNIRSMTPYEVPKAISDEIKKEFKKSKDENKS